jgi:hypothetical protein
MTALALKVIVSLRIFVKLLLTEQAVHSNKITKIKHVQVEVLHLIPRLVVSSPTVSTSSGPTEVSSALINKLEF